MRCADFGVVVFKASMVNCRGAICHGYMHIVLYIYRSTTRCAKFGVVVLQASMLNWGSVCHGYHGISLPWVYVHCVISETYLE